jgi:SSS family solute:Na+ symporter
VLALAVIGLALAYKPPATILQIATQTFTGLAVLFPTTIAALYWRRATAKAAMSSIVVGEAMVVLYYFKLLPTFGFLPVIPVMIVSTLVLIVVSYFTPISVEHVKEYFRDLPTIRPALRKAMYIWLAIFGAIFILSIDFWAWGSSRLTMLGFPWWVWYFVVLNILLVVAMIVFSKKYWKPQEKSDHHAVDERDREAQV